MSKSPDCGLVRPSSRTCAILMVLTGSSWLAGFFLNEDTSGGAQYDFETFHWPASQLFADKPFLSVLSNYPSATMPLQHILMGSLPWVHNPFAYRLTSFFLGTLALFVFGLAVRRRLAVIVPGKEPAILATCAVALSPGFRSATFWGDTDALPLLFSSIACLLLHDEVTGTWSNTVPLRRVVLLALVSSAAFYTRQLYVFAPIFTFWILCSRAAYLRGIVAVIFAISAIPALGLFWLWAGFTPPQFRPISTVTSLIYVPALALPFAIPFLCAKRWSAWRRPSKTAVAGGLLLFSAVFTMFHALQLTTSGGGIVTKIGLLLGPLGVLFVAAAASLGWWLIVATILSSWDNAILFVSAIGPLFLAGFFFQRYFDPLAFAVVLLFLSPPLVRKLVTMRSIVAGLIFFIGLETIGLFWYALLGHVNPNT